MYEGDNNLLAGSGIASITISEENSKEKDIYLDAYVEFSKPLYEDNEKSNEIYFNELLKDCAKVLRYRSFYLIDNKNNITIKIIIAPTVNNILLI